MDIPDISYSNLTESERHELKQAVLDKLFDILDRKRAGSPTKTIIQRVKIVQ